MIKVTVPWIFKVEDADIEKTLEDHTIEKFKKEGINITRLVHLVDSEMEVHFETEEDRLAYMLAHNL